MNATLTLVHFLHASVSVPSPVDGDLVTVHTPTRSMRAWMIRRSLPQPNTVCVPYGPGAPVTDEHVVAFSSSERGWRNVADVLVTSDEALLRPTAGWFVAAVTTPDSRCALLTRDDWSAKLTPLTVLPGQPSEEIFGLYASFIHSWLVSGQPLQALDQAVLSVRGIRHRLGGDSSLRAAS